MEEKGGKPIYTYHRSDMDRESPLYIPPSLRQRWRVRFPSRFEVGSPLPQDGFKPAGGEAGGEAADANSPLKEGAPPKRTTSRFARLMEKLETAKLQHTAGNLQEGQLPQPSPDSIIDELQQQQGGSARDAYRHHH